MITDDNLHSQMKNVSKRPNMENDEKYNLFLRLFECEAFRNIDGKSELEFVQNISFSVIQHFDTSNSLHKS